MKGFLIALRCYKNFGVTTWRLFATSFLIIAHLVTAVVPAKALGYAVRDSANKNPEIFLPDTNKAVFGRRKQIEAKIFDPHNRSLHTPDENSLTSDTTISLVNGIHLDNVTYYSYFNPDTTYSCVQEGPRTIICNGYMSIVGTRPDLFGLYFDLSMHIRSDNFSNGVLRHYYSFEGTQTGGQTASALNKFVYVRYGDYHVPFEVADAGYLDLNMGPEPYNNGDWHIRLNTSSPGYSWSGNFSLTVSLDPIVPTQSLYNFGEIKKYIQDVVADQGFEISSIHCAQIACGDPINTLTGVFSFASPDLSFPTTAGDMVFQRAYSSGTIGIYDDILGFGWTHNHDTRLLFPTDPGGTADFVIFKDTLGNQYRYIMRSDGSFEPWPGVLATLVKSDTIPATYTLTDPEQAEFVFDENGRILSRADAQGHKFEYFYGETGKLTRISADQGTRYLDLSYDEQGRIVSVTDYAGRQVSYSYNATGDLVSIGDLLDRTWSYTYDSAHHLTQVLDPSEKQTLTTEYDMNGRAYRQFDGEGNLMVQIVYNADGSTTVYDAKGNAQTHTFNENNVVTEKLDELNRATNTAYDENFRPTIITNAAGHTLTMEWSADGRNLLSKTDPAGNTTSYTYDSLNNLTSTTDPLGNVTTYTYDPLAGTGGKLLTSKTGPDGKTTSYTYTAQGWLETETDAYGRTTTYAYDVHGQKTSVSDWRGQTTTYVYDDLGRLIETIDPRGRVSRSEYNQAGQLLRSISNYDPNRSQNAENQYNIVTTYEYDLHGNQVKVTDSLGRLTRYEYDDADRLVRTIDPAGNVTTNVYDENGLLASTTDALNQTTSYVYDAVGRRLTTIDALEQSSGTTTFNIPANTSTATDAAGHSATYYYDEINRVVKVVDPLGNQSTTTYDANGNVATRTDQLGRIIRYEYDALGRLVSTIDPLGGVTETVYDSDGNRTATIDALGNQTSFTYDDQGRLLTTTDALGHTTTNEYDADGNLIATSDALGHIIRTEYDEWGRRTATVDAAGRRTTYTYDALDRVISTTDPTGTTSATYDALGNVIARTDVHSRTSTTTYDVLGRVVSTTDFDGGTTTNEYDAVGNLVSTIDALGNTTTYTYDALNRRIATTDPLGNTSRVAYDILGNVTDETDANGVITHYVYDELNRRVAVIRNYRPGVQPDAETNVRVDYTYNAVGNRTQVKDANGHVTEFQYDALNRVTRKIDPLGNTWVYAYDLAGNLISRTDGNNQTIDFTYNALHQLTLIDYPSTGPGQVPDPNADVSFTYNAIGQRISMTDGLGTTTWVYDDLGRLESVTDPHGKVVRYTYDEQGNRTGLEYPGGKHVAYSYDADNHLAEVADWSSQTTGYEYDALGNLLKVLRPNSADTSFVLNGNGQISALTHTRLAAADTTGSQTPEIMAAYQYIYDAVGNVIHAEENIQLPATLEPSATTTPTPTATPTETSTQIPSSTPTLTPVETATPTAVATVYTLVLQPNGADGQDTYILKSAATTNYGSASEFGVGEKNSSTNSVARGLIKFDLSALPADATILSAKLSIWTNQDLSDTDTTLEVFRLKTAFNEAQATWNQSSAGVNWQTAGAAGANDREASSIGAAQVHANESIGTEIQVDLMASKLQEMITGSFTNHGFLLATNLELNDRFGYKASETTTQALRPMLVIQFTSPSQQPTATPTPVPTSTATGTPTLQPTSTASSTPSPSPVPGSIFADGFESGSLSSWSSAVTDNGNLSASVQAAAIGMYGMQVIANGSNAMYVRDFSPNLLNYYRSRFYLDPNSFSMVSGDQVYIYASSNNNFRLSLIYTATGYWLQSEIKDDAGNYNPGGYHFISDDWQAVEIEWKAASSIGANDGFLSIWLNDTLVETRSGLDNDTQVVDYVSLGLLSSLDAGMAGELHFDGFVSHSANYIGLDPNGPLLVAPQNPPDQIMADDFEIGDFSHWSGSVTDNGDLSVSALAAFQGTLGLEALIDDTNNLFLSDNSLLDLAHYRARFYLNPNSLTMSEGSSHDILVGYNQDHSDSIFRLYFYQLSGQYKLRASLKNDSASNLYSNKYAINDDWVLVEVEWQAASAPGANDGFLSLWIDNTLVETIGAVDNETLAASSVDFGLVGSVDSSTSGSMYFDQYESFRESSHQVFQPSRDDLVLADGQGGNFAKQVSLAHYKPAVLPMTASGTLVSIDYSYDALGRLINVSYSNGTVFHYTYDAAGNVLEYRATVNGIASTTTYTYDTANQLLTATKDSTTWHYTYDGNGSLIQSTPGESVSNGAKRYTYSAAGFLVKVETYTNGWQPQAVMAYDGLGNRLEMTGYADGQSVTTQYELDNGRVLAADAGDLTTYYLYGLGPIGELTTTWAYSLPDGSNTPRQLVNGDGEVTLTSSYTPWGDTLSTSGTGNFTYGYFGSMMDTATGLLYVGNGQYYDPATGRFLTRDAKPNQNNPYTPVDPTGALFAPLALLVMVFGRKKTRGKWDNIVILLVLGCAVGMSLVACKLPGREPTPEPSSTPEPAQPTSTATPEPGQGSNSSPTPAGEPSRTPSPTCTNTLTPTPSPTGTPGTVDEELALYGVRFTASPEHLMTQWTPERKTAVRNAVVDIANRFGGAADFRAVYEHVDFEWCIAGATDCADIFGWAYDDHLVKFGGIYTNEVQATRLVVHELGHVVDRMVCANRRTNGECDDPNHNSARTDLEDVWNTLYCGRDEDGNPYNCLSRNTHSGPERGMYWGFAGGWQEWQFGATHGPGEVWADMFLAWVYNKWGNDPYGFAVHKRDYMDLHMGLYLNELR